MSLNKIKYILIFYVKNVKQICRYFINGRGQKREGKERRGC